MAKKTGGEYCWETGKVKTGRMPRGSTEDVATVYGGPFAALRRRADRKRAGR